MLKSRACILSILAGLACQPALAVTYYFSGSAPDFSGTFSFDPATSAITDASLNTPGVTFVTPGGTLAPIDNWVRTNFTTWSGGTTFNGGPIVSTGADLWFASQSSLVPSSLDGDISGFFFVSPADFSTPVALNGVSPVGIVGFGDWTLPPENGVPTTGDGFFIGLASVVPEPSSWAMILVGFAGLGFAGYRARIEKRRDRRLKGSVTHSKSERESSAASPFVAPPR